MVVLLLHNIASRARMDGTEGRWAKRKAYKHDPARTRLYLRRNYVIPALIAASTVQLIALAVAAFSIPYDGLMIAPFALLIFVIATALFLLLEIHKWHLLLWDDLTPRRLALYEVIKFSAFMVLFLLGLLQLNANRTARSKVKLSVYLLLYIPWSVMILISLALIIYATNLIRRQRHWSPEADQSARGSGGKTQAPTPKSHVAVAV